MRPDKEARITRMYLYFTVGSRETGNNSGTYKQQYTAIQPTSITAVIVRYRDGKRQLVSMMIDTMLKLSNKEIVV